MDLSQNMAEIGLAVDRFREDNGHYPKTSSDLLEQGYMAKWPPNPYGRGRMFPEQHGESAKAGGFVYAPYLDDGWTLVGYGIKSGSMSQGIPEGKIPGVDWSRVQVHLVSGLAVHRTWVRTDELGHRSN